MSTTHSTSGTSTQKISPPTGVQGGLPPRSSTSIRSFKGMVILLLMWGVMMGLSFPRANFYLLAYFALAPLGILAVRGESFKRMMVMVFLGAWLWWVVMLSWLESVTGPGWIALAAYLAMYWVLFAGVLRWVHRRLNWPLTITLPVIWVGIEYLRGSWGFGGFPWFSLGHSQPVVMIQIADVVGAYGVSAMVAMVSGMLVDFLVRPLYRRGPSGRQVKGVPLLVSGPLCLMVVMGTLGYGMYRIYETKGLDLAGRGVDGATTNYLRISVVQTNVAQDNKNRGNDEQDRIDFNAMVKLTREAAGQGASLIVWPETMVPRAINDEAVRLFDRYGSEWADYRRAVEGLVEELGVPIVVGAGTRMNWEETADGAKPRTRFNSAYFVEPGVGVGRRYDKIHRVPFGEYIPGADIKWLAGLFAKLTPPEGRSLLDSPLEVGAKYATFDFAVKQVKWSIGTPICFEDVVSHVPRKIVSNTGVKSSGPGVKSSEGKRVDVLVNLTNDAWYPGAAEGPQHEQIARFRCVENRVPMARAVNTGVSGMIDSVGRVVARVVVEGQTQQVGGVVTAEVFKDPRVTLFSQVGDAFAAGCLLLTAVLGLVAMIPSGRKRDQV